MKKVVLALSALALVGCSCSAFAQSAMDIRRGRMAINLRQAGMPSEMVRWAVWASEHKPYTTCAQYADRIDGMMNSPSGDQTGYIPMTIIQMENSGVCRQTVLAKAKPPRQYLEEQKKRDELFSHAHTYIFGQGSSDCLYESLDSHIKDEESSARVSIKCRMVKKKDGYLHTEQCSVAEQEGDSAFPKDGLEYVRNKCWKEDAPPSSMSSDGTAYISLEYKVGETEE